MSYLPQFREGVDRIVKSPKAITICIIVVIIAACTGGWLLCRYYDNVERTDGHDVTQTVRDVTDLNTDAQRELDAARRANQAAERANRNAQRSADNLSGSNATLSGLNQSDAAAIDAAERVFRVVDESNQCAKP